jgi:hypothetical protein
MAFLTDNEECKEAQPSRVNYLKWNLISIIFFILTVFPFMYMKFFSEKSLQNALKDEDDGSDDEDEKDD